MLAPYVRESVVLYFGTCQGRTRSLSLPGPAPGLTPAAVREAAGLIVGARPFDAGSAPSGALAALDRAFLVSVTTTQLL